MRTNISIGRNEPMFSLTDLRELASDLEALATKEIEHNEKIMALIKDPTPKERRIYVTIPHFSGRPFEYRVEDYATNRDGRIILIGSGNYNSNNL